MSDSIIKIENIGKKYIIGHQAQPNNTFRDQITSTFKNVSHKTRKLFAAKIFSPSQVNEEFWALKDITFDIKQGDRVGIIGRNGAGKSTLLKILSRITEPTTGQISIKGRVASLLEVGTGFHPELSGRENIFLNGAILGMSRREIREKFDEIVDFAEIEKFLDTPVKRYSSGMYVRLAFAIAAHLEPEILVVDEVLAVGDAQFQKKCLGKIENVSRQEGRTVIFVSHNMNVIQSICNTGLLLESGKVVLMGNVKECISKYLLTGTDNGSPTHIIHPIDKLKDAQVTEAMLVDDAMELIVGTIGNNSSAYLLVKYKVNKRIFRWHLTFYIRNEQGEIVFFSDRTDFHNEYMEVEEGDYAFRLKLPVELLLPGKYFVSIYCGNEDTYDTFLSQDSITFEIENLNTFRTGHREGYFYQPVRWEQLNYEHNA